jgi:hypothetical protein
MLYTHTKQTDIISQTGGGNCNQTFNLHFHTLPCLQHGGGEEKKKEKVYIFIFKDY